MPSYRPKVYRKQGGSEQVVASGGKITVEAGGTLQQAPVAGGGTLTLTRDTHDGKTILLDTAAGSVVTLPASSGSGARFRFQVSVTATSNSHVIEVANATDIFQGILLALSDDAGAVVKGWETAADSDTITLNRTTTGTAKVGHFIEVEDIKEGVFAVHGIIGQSGTEATPFSAAVS